MGVLRAAYALVNLPGGNVDENTKLQRYAVCESCTHKVSNLCSMNCCVIDILVQRAGAECPILSWTKGNQMSSFKLSNTSQSTLPIGEGALLLSLVIKR